MRKLLITPVSNVDYDKMAVIDNDNMKNITFSDHETVTVYDTVINEIHKIDIARVSLYMDRLILDNKQYHVLHMLSYD